MLSVVKKVRPIKPGDLQSPYSIDMPATAWGLGITYPQRIKRLGHFLTADCKSAGTPNGGKDISGATDRYAGNSLVAGDCKSPEHKVVRSFFDGG